MAGIFAPKSVFPCADCTKETIHTLQEEITSLQEQLESLPQSVKIHLSKSDLQNLNTTPITLVPAQSGKAIEIISVLWYYDYQGTPYNNGVTMSILTNTISNAWCSISISNYTQDINGYVVPLSTSTTTNRWTANQNVVISSIAGLGSGNGTLDLYVLYRYVTI
jgi:hypothetical protein